MNNREPLHALLNTHKPACNTHCLWQSATSVIKLTLFFILVHADVLHRLVSPGLSRGVQCPCLRSVGHGLSIYYGYAQIVNNIILLYLSHSGYGMWIKLYYITLQFLAPPIIDEYNILLLREVTHYYNKRTQGKEEQIKETDYFDRVDKEMASIRKRGIKKYGTNNTDMVNSYIHK